MDVSSILTTLLSSSSVTNIAKATDQDKDDVKSVISAAVPKLLASAVTQSKDKSTAESFTDALAEHASNSTSSLSSFFKNIDLSDGAKIVKHLIGGTTSSETKEIAEEAGVSTKTVSSVLSGVGPLFMSLLGQSTSADSDSSTTSTITKAITSMVKGVDLSSLLGGLLGTSSSSSSSKKTTKSTSTKKTTKSTSSAGSTLSTLASLAGKLLK